MSRPERMRSLASWAWLLITVEVTRLRSWGAMAEMSASSSTREMMSRLGTNGPGLLPLPDLALSSSFLAVMAGYLMTPNLRILWCLISVEELIFY